MALYTKEEALKYHSMKRKGKLEVMSIKPCKGQKHLTMAYSPGVAEACLAIKDNPALAYEYTTKGNLVAVISNGTAVLGLGNIGPLAAKPVMAGKSLWERPTAFSVSASSTEGSVLSVDSTSAPSVGTVASWLETVFIRQTFSKQRDFPSAIREPLPPRRSLQGYS